MKDILHTVKVPCTSLWKTLSAPYQISQRHYSLGAGVNDAVRLEILNNELLESYFPVTIKVRSAYFSQYLCSFSYKEDRRWRAEYYLVSYACIVLAAEDSVPLLLSNEITSSRWTCLFFTHITPAEIFDCFCSIIAKIQSFSCTLLCLDNEGSSW